MTKEEAIARIKDHKIVHKINEPRAIYISEALDMAIKALEQEPKEIGHCKDCKYFKYDSIAKVYFCEKWCDGIIHCRVKEDGYCFMFES